MTTREKEQILYLRRLLYLRIKLMKNYANVKVTYRNKPQKFGIIVEYYGRKPGINCLFESDTIEFPLKDLGKRINHYKKLFRNEFKNRHIV